MRGRAGLALGVLPSLASQACMECPPPSPSPPPTPTPDLASPRRGLATKGSIQADGQGQRLMWWALK